MKQLPRTGTLVVPFGHIMTMTGGIVKRPEKPSHALPSLQRVWRRPLAQSNGRALREVLPVRWDW